ncbi:MAG: hypothetical protein WCH39_24665, partial [Schlesneria sp.]
TIEWLQLLAIIRLLDCTNVLQRILLSFDDSRLGPFTFRNAAADPRGSTKLQPAPECSVTSSKSYSRLNDADDSATIRPATSDGFLRRISTTSRQCHFWTGIVCPTCSEQSNTDSASFNRFAALGGTTIANPNSDSSTTISRFPNKSASGVGTFQIKIVI